MKPLLLLHGALGSANMFTDLQKHLAGSFDIHIIDFYGHGQNANPVDWSIEIFAQQLLDYIGTHQLKSVSVFGYSMGGYIALHAAAKQPDCFEQIMILATKFEWNEKQAAHEAKMLDADILLQKVPAFTETLAKRHPHILWRDMLARMANVLLALGHKPLLTPDILKQIHTRVLISIGDRDQMVSLEESIAAYKQLPQAQLVVLPTTPHLFEKMNTDLLIFHMRSFFIRGEM